MRVMTVHMVLICAKLRAGVPLIKELRGTRVRVARWFVGGVQVRSDTVRAMLALNLLQPDYASIYVLTKTGELVGDAVNLLTAHKRRAP